MATARHLTRQASEALDEDRPDAARVLADLALVHIRLGLQTSTANPDPEPAGAPDSGAELPADLPQPRSAQDWDDPALPADCAPGRAPALLTDAQALARIRHGHQQGWAQRRIAAFSGRATGTVHKHIARYKEESNQR